MKKKFHFVVWIIFIFYEVVIAGLISGRFAKVPSYVLYYALNIYLFYFHAHVVLTFGLKSKRSLWVLPLLLLSELTGYFLVSMCLDYVIINYVGYDGPKFKILSLHHLIGPLYRCIYFIIFSSGYYFLMNYLRERRKTADLESQRLHNEIQIAKSENAFLKAQIQPHLLFNTLDFIYHSARDSSPVAAETILSLSEMMRYSVDSNHNKDLVSLKEEINQVENLINLHQLRKGHSLQIHLFYENEIEDVLIIPLVLITLVENIFKHGDLSQLDNPAQISIAYQDGILLIETINLKKNNNEQKSLRSGLENVRKRLNFAYQDRHELNFSTEMEHFFTVRLSISNPNIICEI
ncbi:sensor histidine kinase [Pedobacter frigidisoli]|uniref:sensor histidine kinase n=1 Tax=Pedobacter frigidisoli TaxID=2530455 RepID=UPI00292E172F|nr:histidine kinase [Pedobacter frigidisoli]